MSAKYASCRGVRIFLALMVFAIAPNLPGQDVPNAKAPAPAAAKNYPWKAEDVIFQETAAEFRISPDSKWALWVKSTGDKEKDERVSNLYLSSLTEKKKSSLRAERTLFRTLDGRLPATRSPF